jgi:3-oxoacyl-[acyl-carrier protein] reductase
MTDRYQDFASSSLGKLLVKNLGLPNPVKLDRYVAGAPLMTGTVVLGGAGRLVEHLPSILDELGIDTTMTPEAGSRYKALLFDATGLTDPGQLVALRDFFTPLMRSLESCARLVVVGTPPEQVSGAERIAQRALEGFTRSLG